MGPWTHGAWARGDGRAVGDLDFGGDTAAVVPRTIELPFFVQHLKDKSSAPVAEARMFETGTNRWRTFEAWPPAAAPRRRCISAPGRARPRPRPPEADAYDEYLSDPNKPVPYVGHVQMGMQRDYMTEDQRFAGDAARRAGLPDASCWTTT